MRSSDWHAGRRVFVLCSVQMHAAQVDRTGSVSMACADTCARAFLLPCCMQSTPVWRAGPAGPKTLCNACGVRYMKVAKRK